MKQIKHIKTAMRILDMDQKKFAEEIGVTQGLVSKWLSGHKVPGWKSAQAIDDATDGNVSRSEIRPDIYQKQLP